MLMIMDGFEVSMRSRMLPEAMRVGSFTMFCSPKSLVISSSLLCLLAVLLGSRGELQGIRGGHLVVDNKMQSICICFVQSEFLSKLFHNLSLNFGEVQLQCCHGRL